MTIPVVLVESPATNNRQPAFTQRLFLFGLWLPAHAVVSKFYSHKVAIVGRISTALVWGLHFWLQTSCKAGILLPSGFSDVRQPIKSDLVRPISNSGRPRKKFSRLKAPRPVQQKVANRILRQRNRRGLSVARLSRLSGINRSHLTTIERGSPNLRISTMLQLVRPLDTTIAELLRGVEKAAEKATTDKDGKAESDSKLTRRKTKGD